MCLSNRDFVADSESEFSDSSLTSSSSSSSSSSASSSSTEGVKRKRGRPPKNLNHHKPKIHLVQPRTNSITKMKMKKKIKQDRFYDRSRNIPNDVYFGDVKVPLHILHTKWNEEESSGDERKSRPSISFNRNVNQNVIRIPSASKIVQRYDQKY
jgi:hypothetical protein